MVNILSEHSFNLMFVLLSQITSDSQPLKFESTSVTAPQYLTFYELLY